jgi:uncharacterized membrane protein YphA (DoxX/SURF4 family)
VRLPGSILQGILARAALVLLRIYLGVIFLLAAWQRLTGDFTPRFAGFLEVVALDRGPQIAVLITWGELLVGLTLVLGLMTRLSATLALLLLGHYLLAKGGWFCQCASNDGALAAIAVALLVGAAGRTFGLDALLAKRWPRSPFW